MISVGAGIEAAARHVGCSTWTIRREAQRDEAFARQLQEAETACQLAPLRMVRQAAETQWRAAAWLLERTCPERFARRSADAVTPGELEDLLEKTASILVDECYDQPHRQHVVQRLRELQEAHFGERRAGQQGPAEPQSEIERLLQRVQRERFGAALGASDGSSASKTSLSPLGSAPRNSLAG